MEKDNMPDFSMQSELEIDFKSVSDQSFNDLGFPFLEQQFIPENDHNCISDHHLQGTETKEFIDIANQDNAQKEDFDGSVKHVKISVDGNEDSVVKEEYNGMEKANMPDFSMQSELEIDLESVSDQSFNDLDFPFLAQQYIPENDPNYIFDHHLQGTGTKEFINIANQDNAQMDDIECNGSVEHVKISEDGNEDSVAGSQIMEWNILGSGSDNDRQNNNDVVLWKKEKHEDTSHLLNTSNFLFNKNEESTQVVYSLTSTSANLTAFPNLNFVSPCVSFLNYKSQKPKNDEDLSNFLSTIHEKINMKSEITFPSAASNPQESHCKNYKSQAGSPKIKQPYSLANRRRLNFIREKTAAYWNRQTCSSLPQEGINNPNQQTFSLPSQIICNSPLQIRFNSDGQDVFSSPCEQYNTLNISNSSLPSSNSFNFSPNIVVTSCSSCFDLSSSNIFNLANFEHFDFPSSDGFNSVNQHSYILPGQLNSTVLSTNSPTIINTQNFTIPNARRSNIFSAMNSVIHSAQSCTMPGLFNSPCQNNSNLSSYHIYIPSSHQSFPYGIQQTVYDLGQQVSCPQVPQIIYVPCIPVHENFRQQLSNVSHQEIFNQSSQVTLDSPPYQTYNISFQ